MWSGPGDCLATVPREGSSAGGLPRTLGLEKSLQFFLDAKTSSRVQLLAYGYLTNLNPLT
jgi:hypothetical protein